MKAATKKRTRLYGKDTPRLPKPKIKKRNDKGFALRLLNEQDNRFAVVKQLRHRLQQLIDDTQPESITEEWLAARAVFMLAYLESMEVTACEGNPIDWAKYVSTCNALNNLLSKLGANANERRSKNSLDLDSYLTTKKNGNGSKH